MAIAMVVLEVHVDTTSDHVVVALRGELDIATVPTFHRQMTRVRATPGNEVVIDATELSFVCVRGLRALTSEAEALRQCRRRVRTVNLAPNVRRVARLFHAEAQLGATCGSK